MEEDSNTNQLPNVGGNKNKLILIAVAFLVIGVVAIILVNNSSDTENQSTVSQENSQSDEISADTSSEEASEQSSTGATNNSSATNPDSNASAEASTQVNASDDQTENEANSSSSQGQFIDYRDGLLEEYKTSKRWLFFHADWCPECRALATDINNHLQSIPADVVIMKVDYDSSDSLKRTYGITIQTTVISIDSDNQEIGRVVAYGSNNKTLESLIENLYE